MFSFNDVLYSMIYWFSLTFLTKQESTVTPNIWGERENISLPDTWSNNVLTQKMKEQFLFLWPGQKTLLDYVKRLTNRGSTIDPLLLVLVRYMDLSIVYAYTATLSKHLSSSALDRQYKPHYKIEWNCLLVLKNSLTQKRINLLFCSVVQILVERLKKSSFTRRQ
jgi:hypothetical protein